VEIKGFLGESELTEFEWAIGQYLLYRSLILREEPDRILYLAIPKEAFDGVFQDRITQPLLAELSVPLLVFQPEVEVILRWMP
jgi:hypothetical protein